MVKTWLFDIFNYPASGDTRQFDHEYCQDLFDWHMESWVAAEKAGFEGLFFSEHHYTPYSVSPSPNLLVAAAAQRTTSMKLGVMANIIAMHNPRRLAEEAAMLDYLTHGRLEMGLGRGIDEREFAREGIPMEESRPRFEEGLGLMRSMLQEPVFTHKGKYSNFPEPTSLWPQARNRPFAPWIVTLSPATIEWCARQGYRISTAFQPTASLAEVHKQYRQTAAEAGQPSGPEQIMVLRNVFCAETDEEARAIAEPALNYMFGLFREAIVWDNLDNVPEGYQSDFYEAFFRPFAASGPVNWDILSDLGILVVGSPKTVREKLEQQMVELGSSNLMIWGSFGTLTKEQTIKSFELIGQEVIPALAKVTVQ
jgi:alkanesulfonate monooxygenase SsuD/methylene tetrahydromethanopterin reductase-like flavin-dependent oxidoreductase (luciferase family)